MKKFEGDDRKIFLEATNKVISMMEAYEDYEGVVTKETEKKVIVEGKKNYENLYTKLLRSEELNQAELILLISALDSTITLMVKQRNQMSEAIKMLDQLMNRVIEENLENVQ